MYPYEIRIPPHLPSGFASFLMRALGAGMVPRPGTPERIRADDMAKAAAGVGIGELAGFAVSSVQFSRRREGGFVFLRDSRLPNGTKLEESMRAVDFGFSGRPGAHLFDSSFRDVAERLWDLWMVWRSMDGD